MRQKQKLKNKTKKLIKQYIIIIFAVSIGIAIINTSSKVEAYGHTYNGGNNSININNNDWISLDKSGSREYELERQVTQSETQIKKTVEETNHLCGLDVVVCPNEPDPMQDIEEYIKTIAKEMNFKWTDYLIKLAKCESRLDPKATNDKGNTPKGSIDRGLFQFNSYWQKRVSDECAFSIDCSTKEAIKMINAGKQHLWVCDKIVLAKD